MNGEEKMTPQCCGLALDPGHCPVPAKSQSLIMQNTVS